MLYMETKYVEAKSTHFSHAIAMFDWSEIYYETDMQKAFSLFRSNSSRL